MEILKDRQEGPSHHEEPRHRPAQHGEEAGQTAQDREEDAGALQHGRDGMEAALEPRR